MGIMLAMLSMLVLPYVALTIAGGVRGRAVASTSTRGCIGIAIVFAFAGLGHFLLTEPMVRMLPAWVPQRTALVYATGVLELALAAAVLVPRWRRTVGWVLIVMLALFLPVNIYAAANRIPIGGHEAGAAYLLLRVPMQAFMAAWIWWFAVRKSAP